MDSHSQHVGSKTRLLKCIVDQGMFSDERAVTYPATTDYNFPVFVPQSEIVEGKEFSAVRVTVVSANGDALVMLPTPDRNLVTVKQADLVEEDAADSVHSQS